MLGKMRIQKASLGEEIKQKTPKVIKLSLCINWWWLRIWFEIVKYWQTEKTKQFNNLNPLKEQTNHKFHSIILISLINFGNDTFSLSFKQTLSTPNLANAKIPKFVISCRSSIENCLYQKLIWNNEVQLD